ncbi:MAG TPA: N-acetyltransferase [Devosia sp.]|nr:N-acetyltransferase [Devosia sp.]
MGRADLSCGRKQEPVLEALLRGEIYETGGTDRTTKLTFSVYDDFQSSCFVHPCHWNIDMTSPKTPSAPVAGDLTSDSPPNFDEELCIRAQTDADADWVEKLQAEAFGPGRFARTAFRVRERFAIDPSLSLTAEIGGRPVGSVWMTPISLGGINGYLLGPLATDPAFRNRGIGRALVRQVTKNGMAREGVKFVLLVGDAPYYVPLGYDSSTPGAIIFPGPVDPARILVHGESAGFVRQLAGTIGAFVKNK